VGTGPTTCSGGSISYSSADGTTTITGAFTSGSYAESCAGGGKGGHVTCGFSLTGYFNATLTVNGAAQAITGVTYQGFDVGGPPSGRTAYNSAYSPFYYSDSEQIHRSDDLLGTNQISYGSQGSGVGQFYGANGIALDSAGRIYISDTYNCRVVRIDDMNGTNWTSYGVCGSGPGQFSDPAGISLDSAGRIYVMDAGNERVVRMDNMSGANWASYGSLGTGMGQFSQWLTSLALDTSARIYVADTGNKRIVRFDDMTGTNWTALTQSVPVNGVSYSFSSPVGVAVDPGGRIYVGDATSYQPEVVRVDDMTGANWTYLFLGANAGLNSIAVDSSGTVFIGGGGAKVVDNMTGVISSSEAIGPIGSYYVFALTPLPLPAPRPSAIGFSPSTLSLAQNVGTSGTQALTISNFGGSPMHLWNISATSPFTQTNNCPAQLNAGSTCAVNVTFAPSATGAVSGSVNISDDSGNLGAAQNVTISGMGTAPAASVAPASLTFSSQVVGTTSAAKTVTLKDTGTGPMLITNISVSGPFTQSNNCTTVAAGSSCTIQVSFAPTALGSATGSLTIVDNAGTQTVPLSGTGGSPLNLSPGSIEFNNVIAGNTSAAQNVTVTNRGSVIINIASIATAPPFAIATSTCGSTLAAAANCSVSVTFSPTAAGQFNGSLLFTDDALGSPQKVSLAGNAVAPVSLSASTLNFSTVIAGNTSSAKTVTLTNHQTVALVFSTIAVTAGFNISSNTCGSGIAAGASCTVGVTFQPAAVGSATGALTFTDNAPNSPQTLNLTGTGGAPVTFSSSSLNFGTVTSGTTSSAKTVTVTNHLSAPLSFASIATAAPFAISSNTCGASIAAGGTCTVGVTFSPTAAGAVTGALTFTDSALTSPQTMTLTGTGR
jgi:hypothetical protein